MQSKKIGSAIIIPVLLQLIACGPRSQDPQKINEELARTDSPKLTKESMQVLDSLARLNPKPIESLTFAEARRQPTFGDAVTALLKDEGKSTQPLEIGSVAPVSIALQGRTIPARVYTPKGSGPFPVLVYYHGGGWVLADLDTYDASCRALAKAANRVVVSVHYRQAPEFPFPAAVDDAVDSYAWVLNNYQSINGDIRHVAIGGESAGANLAAATTLFAREHGIREPEHQLLVYPVTDLSFNTPSYRRNAFAKPLNAQMMKWFSAYYLVRPEDRLSPLASPLQANNLSGLPSATIITAEADPLQSDGALYANRLQSSGVKVRFRNFEGVPHEFFGAGSIIPEARDAVEFAASDLRDEAAR